MSTLKGFRAKREQSQALNFCRSCRGERYVIGQRGSRAHASRCSACSSNCEACENTGVIFFDDEYGMLATKICDCQAVQPKIDLFNAAKVPSRYFNATLLGTKTRNNASIAQVRSTLDKFHWSPGAAGIGVSGPVGVGKTHMMCAWVRKLTLEHGVGARFIEFSQLLTDIKEGYDQGRSEAEIVKELGSVPVLVIDELGKGLTTDWQHHILDELISRRYNQKRTTAFTTNYPFSRDTKSSRNAGATEGFAVTLLEDKIGHRMFSRLQELCDLYMIDASDYRKELAKQRAALDESATPSGPPSPPSKT